MNIAAKVAEERRAHPERFCTRCLWRTSKRGVPSPCPKHPRVAPRVLECVRSEATS